MFEPGHPGMGKPLPRKASGIDMLGRRASLEQRGRRFSQLDPRLRQFRHAGYAVSLGLPPNEPLRVLVAVRGRTLGSVIVSVAGDSSPPHLS